MLLNEEGNLVSSKGFRAHVIDPSTIPDLDIPKLHAEEEMVPVPSA